MDELIAKLARLTGLSEQASALILSLSGAAIAAGALAFILYWLLGKNMSAPRPRLMPTMAEDVLDPDLLELYQRSFWLDAPVSWGGRDSGALPNKRRLLAELSALGRAIRRLCLRVQAGRASGAAGKTRDFSAQIDLMSQLLDEALELSQGIATHLSAGSANLFALKQMTRRVDKTRRVMGDCRNLNQPD